jgi:hypothetical protein
MDSLRHVHLPRAERGKRMLHRDNRLRHRQGVPDVVCIENQHGLFPSRVAR